LGSQGGLITHGDGLQTGELALGMRWGLRQFLDLVTYTIRGSGWGIALTLVAPTLSEMVNAGNAFFRRVMEVDGRKAQMAKEEMEHALTGYVIEFVRAAALDLDVSISFCDVHALMNKNWHTELAYVRLNGRRCDLLFHDRLMSFTDRHSGFIFVAKSWVLLMVLAEMMRYASAVQSEFVFEIGDTGTLDQVSFNASSPNACLILDHEFAAKDGYAEYRAQCNSEMVPWEERTAKVFWRGSTTGKRLYPPPSPGQPDDLSWLPRLQFCIAARLPTLQALCDVGITSIVQTQESHLDERIRA
jgi:hypothetical protein